MDLLRDVLDKAVVDRNGRDMGRVDRIVLELHDGKPPRVVGFEIGPTALASRVSSAFGRWVEAIERACRVDQGRPVRISLEQVLDLGDHIKVDVAFGETGAANVERRLKRWMSSIPGSA